MFYAISTFVGDLMPNPFLYKQSSISNNSTWHAKTVPFQAIQFSISTHFSTIDPIRCYHSGPEWTWEQWQ